MKFNEILYTRPNIDDYEAAFVSLLNTMKSAETYCAFEEAMLKLYITRDNFDTQHQLAHIKYTTNTGDKTYQKESNYFDEILPKNQELINQFYAVLDDTPYKKELNDNWGTFLSELANYRMKAFDPIILENSKEENKLKSEYMRLKGTAQIEFRGESYNLAGIGKFLVDDDRETRREASMARWKFFSDNQNQFDDLFDKLVKNRHEMAVKMGHENFIDLGYIRMDRVDYNQEMVANFRRQIAEHIVPIVKKLRERQQKRLGYDRLNEYDLDYWFLSGNPAPKGSPEEILQRADEMYAELSAETDDFFQHMRKYDLLDVINRPGKADVGYCWELTDYKHPFIFANFNGTSGDIDVLTHEAGHAFQYYCSRNTEITEYRWPSSEACEIHSMSMEFLTYPWMEGFFKEDSEKYYFSHLARCLIFLPYGCAVDHFQHLIYSKPNATPDERGEMWKEMEALYLPDRNHDWNDYLKSGRFWQRQGHIYESPFYYIDYVLAEICAFQFWQKNDRDKKSTWDDYLRLCKAGGKFSFLKLVELANLRSPFEDGAVESIANDVVAYLDQIDDSKF